MRINTSRSSLSSVNAWLLAVAVLGTSLNQAEALTLKHAFRVAGWSGGAYSDARTKAFDRCTATTNGQNDTSISYSVDNQFRWGVTVSNAGWNFLEGAVQNARLQFAGVQGSTIASAIAIQKTVLSLQSTDTIGLFAHLKSAQKLRIIIGGLALEFSLDGSHAVLSSLTQCVLRSTKSNNKLKSKNSAFDSREASSEASAIKEANSLAAKVISYSRVSDAKSLASSDNAFSVPIDAGWQIGLVKAGITIITSGLPKEQITEAVMAIGLRSCQGGFFFISTPATINESPATRILASCQTIETTVSSYHLVVPRPKSGHYILTAVGTGSSIFPIAHRAAGEYEARLRTIVMLAINKLD